ncbi:MAG: bile acid:sodium symporter [Crocinitomicaceae bacterium]
MDSLSDILLPIGIGLIMFGIGTSLKFSDFKMVITKPKAVITGLVCQLILLPIIAFLLIYFWPIDPVYKVGMIIIASAPGGTSSNLVTHMLKGRVALSVSLTSFNSFIILLTIPLYISIALQLFMGESESIVLSPYKVTQEILLLVLIPVLLGITLNEFTSKQFTENLKQPLRYIMPALLIGLFLIVIFADEGHQIVAFKNNLHLYIPLVIFNLITMLMGFYVAKSMKIDHESSYTIAVEMGLQNSALAIFIAAQLLDNQKMELMAVLYASFSFFSTWFFAWVMKHYLKPAENN